MRRKLEVEKLVHVKARVKVDGVSQKGGWEEARKE